MVCGMNSEWGSVSRSSWRHTRVTQTHTWQQNTYFPRKRASSSPLASEHFFFFYVLFPSGRSSSRTEMDCCREPWQPVGLFSVAVAEKGRKRERELINNRRFPLRLHSLPTIHTQTLWGIHVAQCLLCWGGKEAPMKQTFKKCFLFHSNRTWMHSQKHTR